MNDSKERVARRAAGPVAHTGKPAGAAIFYLLNSDLILPIMLLRMSLLLLLVAYRSCPDRSAVEGWPWHSCRLRALTWVKKYIMPTNWMFIEGDDHVDDAGTRDSFRSRPRYLPPFDTWFSFPLECG